MRAGETHRFICPDGFHVKSQSDETLYINASCLPTGLFQATTEICEGIPCRQVDINTTMASQPGGVAGGMTTATSGDVEPSKSIYFSCSQTGYVSSTVVTLECS